jgi:glycosyltransferase involved in cell wall biosynthesis
MRVLYITAKLPFGTDEAFLIPEIAGLRRLGHEVLVVPRSPSGEILHGTELLESCAREGLLTWNVLRSVATQSTGKWLEALRRLRASRSLRIAAKNLAVLPKAAWLAALAQQWKADHIHCHWAGTTATMAMIASEWSGIPWSFTLHRRDIVENNLLLEKVGSAGMVRFLSEEGLRMARALGVPRSGHIRVIHMGVDLPTPVPRTPGRIVLCPARLVDVKGHRNLLDAWKRVQKLGVRAELVLAGDGPLRPNLETLAEILALGDSVRFLGTLPHAQLLELYERGGVAAVILPSVDAGQEGIPVALMEAMSYGVPVIGTRTERMADLVQQGTGLMVEPENPEELAVAIQNMVDNPDDAVRLGQRGRRHVESDFDVRHTTAELVDAIEGARNGHDRGVRNLVGMHARGVGHA